VGLRISLVFFSAATSSFATQMTPVFLSQVYVVVDAASYKAIRASDAIQALASAQEERVSASHGGWTGFYIVGRQTAIEILAASAEGDPTRPGQSGIGLAYGDAANGPVLEKRLRAALGNRANVARSRMRTSDLVPWLDEIDVDGGESGTLSTWFIEMSPGFLVAQYPGSRSDHGRSREQYFAAGFHPERLLDDVVGLSVALNPAETSLLVDELSLAGWTMTQDAGKTVMSGPDIAITILPAGTRSGIREARLRLRHPALRQVSPLGNAELQLDGEAGSLSFGDSG